jgi:Ni,Fe-hydrogenase III small subunit
MRAFVSKILSTPNVVIPADQLGDSQLEVTEIGRQIRQKAKGLFGGSLAIRQVNAGSDDTCEHELTALTNAFYDVERFGVHFVASPRHADMLMVTGPVSRNMAVALERAYNATPDPKIVVAVGDDAIDGGIFKGSYAVLDGVASVVPVHYRIPGDPPSPTVILRSLLEILKSLDTSENGRS